MNSNLNNLLLIALPYAAIVVFIAGLIWRYRSRGTISSLSSQFLESRWLAWGSVPFHLGVAALLVFHLLPLLMPSIWRRLLATHSTLLTIEAIGAASAILCLAGLVVLFIRRAFSSSVRAGSTAVDLVVLALLILQVVLGLGVATMHRWGSVWATGTTTPYLWSIFTLQPNPEFVAGVPPLMTLHLAGAWILLALIPFTRLVHMFSLPLGYLWRRPQRVIWSRPQA